MNSTKDNSQSILEEKETRFLKNKRIFDDIIESEIPETCGIHVYSNCIVKEDNMNCSINADNFRITENNKQTVQTKNEWDIYNDWCKIKNKNNMYLSSIEHYLPHYVGQKEKKHIRQYLFDILIKYK